MKIIHHHRYLKEHTFAPLLVLVYSLANYLANISLTHTHTNNRVDCQQKIKYLVWFNYYKMMLGTYVEYLYVLYELTWGQKMTPSAWSCSPCRAMEVDNIARSVRRQERIQSVAVTVWVYVQWKTIFLAIYKRI